MKRGRDAHKHERTLIKTVKEEQDNPPHFPFVADTNDSKSDRNPQRQTTLMQIPRWAPWLSVIWAGEPIRGGYGRGRSRSAPHVALIGGGAGQQWDCLTPSSGTDADCMNIHLRCLFLFFDDVSTTEGATGRCRMSAAGVIGRGRRDFSDM